MCNWSSGDFKCHTVHCVKNTIKILNVCISNVPFIITSHSARRERTGLLSLSLAPCQNQCPALSVHNNNRETVPAVCDDQMRQKSTAAMQTCLCSTWNKHFAIIQLHQHHTPSYELEDLKPTVDRSLAPSQVLSFPLDANLYCILWEDKCFFPQIYQIHILVRNTFKRGLFRMGKSEFRVIIHGIYK